MILWCSEKVKLKIYPSHGKAIMKATLNKTLINDIIGWDVVNWSKCLNFWEKYLIEPQNKNGLEIGGRQGGLSLWLACHGMNVVCSDVVDNKSTALLIRNKYHFAERITDKVIDATNIPYSDYFDFVVFKSVLGGIGRNNSKDLQIKAINEIYKSLKPGGMLLFAENLDASPLHRFLRKGCLSWGGSWRYINIAEMKQFLSDFSKVDFKTAGFLGCFGRNEMQRTFLAGVDNVLAFLIPQNWRYIIFGVAIK